MSDLPFDPIFSPTICKEHDGSLCVWRGTDKGAVLVAKFSPAEIPSLILEAAQVIRQEPPRLKVVK